MFWGQNAELGTSTWAIFIPKHFLDVCTVLGFKDREVNRTLSLALMILQWDHEPASICDLLLKFSFRTRMILLKMQIDSLKPYNSPHAHVIKAELLREPTPAYIFNLLSQCPDGPVLLCKPCWLWTLPIRTPFEVHWDVCELPLPSFLGDSLTFHTLPFVFISQCTALVYRHFHDTKFHEDGTCLFLLESLEPNTELKTGGAQVMHELEDGGDGCQGTVSERQRCLNPIQGCCYLPPAGFLTSFWKCPEAVTNPVGCDQRGNLKTQNTNLSWRKHSAEW